VTTGLPGSPFPLGATVLDGGTNFAAASEVAAGLTLCLFDAAGHETQVPMLDFDAGVWHTFVPGVKAGQAYGFRAQGPYEPAQGIRCNPAKLLLDPYARAVTGTVTDNPDVLGYVGGNPDTPSDTDSAPDVPRSVVVDPAYGWRDSGPLRRPYADTVIYEVHVKGFTMRHPGVPPALRGTYAGLAHEAATSYLTQLGVTAVELLPVHEFVPEGFLTGRGLTNYWGYNTIGFFAPSQRYSAQVRAGRPGGQVGEFKAMVDALHAAGLEVILDVVFNHSAEGNELGPTLCFRGLDNPAYYRLDDGDPRHYFDTTGTGNSLNTGHPRTLQLIMDSLRYWLTEMHVDGFRFDLAATLARADGGFDTASAFFDLVSQDPVVSQAKLIAEPWDVGQLDSYDLGRFPPLWSEWNGRYRDSMRDFWRSHPIGLGEFATRFAGSSDLYGGSRRRPTASVNLVTVHDGFTLRDLVSYQAKHNEANGEDNRDGSDDNRSWNCGAEGPTDDPRIQALRARQQRNFLVTLLLSQGVPMLVAGDEMGRTQQGNNNAYCQDNEISWVAWPDDSGHDASPGLQQADEANENLLDFTRALIQLRARHPVFRRRRYFQGEPISGAHGEVGDIAWFTAAGEEMTDDDWAAGFAKSLTVFLNGNGISERDLRGEPVRDDSFLLMFNASEHDLKFAVPAPPYGEQWKRELDTSLSAQPADGNGADTDTAARPGGTVEVRSRSLQVLRRG
jgi:isoamylase